MHSAVLSRSKIDEPVFSDREIYTQPTSIDKGHAALFVAFHSCEDILLVGVCLTLKLHKLGEFEALLHRPFYDTAVT